MKQKFYIIGIGLLLAAVIIFAKLDTIKSYIQPASTLEVSGTAVPLMSSMGTSFISQPGLVDGTESAVIPQTDGTGITIWPKHIEITLVDYPLEGTTTRKPQISVFPAKEFAQMGLCPKAAIDGLETILKTQKLLLAEPLPCVFIPDSLPFLPDQHAAQMFHAQEKILSFQNGSGIRYITQYSQASFPLINNMEMFYTFQGLSTDGKYYVSVILPINLNSLDGIQAPNDADTYPDYLNTTMDLLNGVDNPFNPSLESLDNLIQSLFIGIQEGI